MASTADLVTDSVTDLSQDNGFPKNEEKSDKKMNLKERFAYIREMTTIEPLLCFYVLASIVCGPAIRNLQLEMACFGNKGYNDTVCEAILNDKRLDDTWKNQSSEVNRIITNMGSWCTPVQSFIPVIYLIFLGTFSDRHKIRKPFMLIPIIGEFFACICCILCVIFKKSWPVEVEGVAQVIVPSLLGGPEMMSMAAYAYISDVSTPEKRIARIGMLQLCLSFGAPVGLLFTAQIFPVIKYIGSFVLGFVFFLLALIYGAIKVKEPRASGEETNTKALIADMFNPKHAIETFKLLVKTQGGQRKNIIFILAIYCIVAFIDTGEGVLFFNFANHAYGWDGTDVTYYGAAASVINLVALGIGIPLLSNVLGLHGLLIIAVAFADKIIANIIILAVRTPCGLYMSLVAGIMGGVAGAGINSQTTKYVSEDDMGKIQSLLLILGFVARTIGVEIYTHGVWKFVDNSYPQSFYLVGVVVFIPTILALIWKYYKEKTNPPPAPVEVPVAENGTELQTPEGVGRPNTNL